jgi:hypothetical protein
MKKVKVTSPALRIRKAPDLNSNIIGVIRDKGVYDITVTRKGFGKLANLPGWICLSYTEPAD